MKATRRPTKVRITTLIDRDLLMWLKIGALEARMGYQTYLNQVLSEHAGLGSYGARRSSGAPPEIDELGASSEVPLAQPSSHLETKVLSPADLQIFSENLARSVAKSLAENLSTNLSAHLATNLAENFATFASTSFAERADESLAEPLLHTSAVAKSECVVPKTIKTPRLRMPAKKGSGAQKAGGRGVKKTVSQLKRKKKILGRTIVKKLRTRGAKSRGGPLQTAKSRR